MNKDGNMPEDNSVRNGVPQTAEAPSSANYLGDTSIDIDLKRLGLLLLKSVRGISSFAIAVAALTWSTLLIIGPNYEARATFLPPNSMSSNAASMSQMGSLGGLGASLSGLKDPTLIYVGMLKSRTIADLLIQEYDLKGVYHSKLLSAAEKKLAERSTFTSEKDSTVSVSVKDKNPKRAAELANAYLSELRKLSDRIALTDAAQRRLFYEHQLDREKGALADAEVALTRTQQKTGLIEPSAQARLQIETIAETQAQIASREVELASLSDAATAANPEVIRLHTQIEHLRAQLGRLEDSNDLGRPGDIQVPVSRVPELTLVYVRNQRDVRYHEALYQSLLKQYEVARLNESMSAPVIQTVDPAVVPDTQSGPRPLTVVTVAFLLGLIVAITWVIGRSRIVRSAY
jgi:tyrosine-protein kinase Etk/Wzc